MHLNSKERILNCLMHRPIDHVPWVPFAGIHAGKLKNYTATEILTNKEKLIESLIEVNKQYHPDGQPVVFDLQIEAEILGCEMLWADKAPPSVVSHPLIDTNEIPTKIPKPTEGRLGLIIEVIKELKIRVGDNTALFGLITGPLTLASHLRGTPLFMDLLRNKQYAHDLFDYATKVACAMVDYYLDAGIDIIAVVDPVVSQISPRAFSSLLINPFAQIFSYIREKKSLSSFFVCGDATKNIEPMCKTNPDSIFVDENIDMVVAKKITDKYNIVIGGNIPLTTTMLYGSQQDNMKYVIDLIEKLGSKNLIIAPGCDMPYDVPPENVIGVVQAVHEPEMVKKSLENYQIKDIDFEIVLPDYNQLQKPLIEVFTIDSAVCAACGYMKNMANTALEKYQGKVDIIEYKWTELENIVRTKKMGIKHLPCIYINGKLYYSSIIPSKDEYFADIERIFFSMQNK